MRWPPVPICQGKSGSVDVWTVEERGLLRGLCGKVNVRERGGRKKYECEGD